MFPYLSICIFLINWLLPLGPNNISQKYPVFEINKDWMNAPAVVRKQEMNVQIGQNGKFVVKKNIAYTILKPKASDLAVLTIPYSSAIKVKQVNGTVYDVLGNVISKSKKSNIQDYSNFSSFSIFEDNRVKIIDLKQVNLPYTVEWEYEVEYPNLYYLPNWVPQISNEVPVESTRATFLYPEEFEPRFFSWNIDENICKTEKIGGGMVSKAWTLENLNTYFEEEMVPLENQRTKVLFSSPAKFVFDGYEGDLSTWEKMGEWIYSLNKGKDQLPESTKREINELVKDLTTDEEKVNALYKYMQNKTRYISIQLGIGGLMPFDAMTVEKNGYGDCKALSNYMAALLKEVGIKSHYTLIYGGENSRPFFEEFPADYFNHIILTVPLEKDTVWLECTSQTNPFGYLGSFTSDRFGLMVNEKGGVLVKTPKYDKSLNKQSLEGKVQLDENGNALMSLKLQATGIQSENGNLLQVSRLPKEDQKKWILNYFELPSFQVKDFSFKKNETFITEVEFSGNFEVKNFSAKSGNRLFLQPNQLNVYSTRVPKSETPRAQRFERKFGFEDRDEWHFYLPENVEVENLPKEVRLENEFGFYHVDYQLSENELVYRRYFSLNDKVYSPEKFTEYVKFISEVEKFDKSKVVLKRKVD